MRASPPVGGPLRTSRAALANPEPKATNLMSGLAIAPPTSFEAEPTVSLIASGAAHHAVDPLHLHTGSADRAI